MTLNEIKYLIFNNFRSALTKYIFFIVAYIILLSNVTNYTIHMLINRYIGLWILLIYEKISINILTKKIYRMKIDQNSWKCLKKTLENNRINKNIHGEIILLVYVNTNIFMGKLCFGPSWAQKLRSGMGPKIKIWSIYLT